MLTRRLFKKLASFESYATREFSSRIKSLKNSDYMNVFNELVEAESDTPDDDISLNHFQSRPLREDSVPRLLQVAMIGAPNSGKSTLTNALVGKKVTAVSPKTNTTAQSRLGAFTVDNSQVVLYDYPGIVDPAYYQNVDHKTRVQSAWSEAADCDILIFIVDAARQLLRRDPRVLNIATAIGSGEVFQRHHSSPSPTTPPPPAILVLNKIDAVSSKRRLLSVVDTMQQQASFEEVFFVSALHGTGIPDLKTALLDKATPGDWILDSESATDRDLEGWALEITREKIFRMLYAELPYDTDVEPVSCVEMADGVIEIRQTIVVRNEALKKIVVGKKGKVIDIMVEKASIDLERTWQRPVKLVISVKTRK
jgi:GTPase